MIVQGKIEKQPIEYRRAYRFYNDKLSYTLELRATEDAAFKRLVENIAFLSGKELKRNGMIIALAGDPGQKSESDSIIVKDKMGNGITILLSEKHKITILTDAMTCRGLFSSRAEIELPTIWQKGRTWKMDVEISPNKVKENQSDGKTQ